MSNCKRPTFDFRSYFGEEKKMRARLKTTGKKIELVMLYIVVLADIHFNLNY